MNVLLLTSAEPKQRHGFSMIEKRFPIGLGYLAAVMEAGGHTVTIHDRFLLGAENYPDKQDWDLVGIYSCTPCIEDTLHLLDYFAEYTTAVGGPHASLFPSTLVGADVIVQGEGELVMLDILEGKRGILKTDRIKHLDSLPVPAYHLFASDDRYDTSMYFAEGKFFNYNSSRGCPYACSFCDVKRIWGRTWYAHSAERVLQDAKMLRDTYKIDGLYFREDNFSVQRRRVKEISKGMGELGLKWACETRVDTIDNELLEIMSDGGCVGVYIGFESGSDRMLEHYSKETTVKKAQETCDLCYKHGIKIQASFITKNPEELLEDTQATTEFVEKNQHVFARVCYNEYRDFSHYERFLKED